MYYPFVMRAEAVVWLVWIVTWHIAGIWRGKATVEAPTSTYRRYFVIIAIGLILIFSAIPKLSWPLLWVTPPALGWTMIGVTVAGIAFAWWARITMGKRHCLRCGCLPEALRRSIEGSTKAAVLPVPVWAMPIRSRPASTVGIACAWIGVGLS